MAQRRIREGRWDCSNCSTRQIKARHKSCPSCGDARNPHTDPSEKPYLLENEPEIVDESLRELALAGPDWTCGHCGSSNKGTRTSCRTCGNPLNESDIHGRESDHVDRRPAIPAVDKFYSEPVEAPAFRDPFTEQRRSPQVLLMDRAQSIANNPKPIIFGVAGILGFAGLIWLVFVLFFQTHTVTLQVTDLSWSRQVEIEAYRTLVEEDWSVPERGRQLRSFEAVHHYDDEFSHNEQRSRQVSEQVRVGDRTVSQTCTRDLGNGFFESYDCSYTVPDYQTQTRTEYYEVPVYVSVPVMRTKYEYEIERWVTARWEVAPRADETRADPYWPVPEILPEKFRVGDDRRETYSVQFSDGEDKNFTQEPDFAVWKLLAEGQDITVQLNRQGKLREVNWPKE